MSEFLSALCHYPFLQYALGAGLLASVSCGVVGSLVVVRRISYLAGAIAHSVLAGLGAARWMQVVLGWQWAHPLLGAVVAALAAAAVMGLVSLKAREREDTVVSALWAVGMAVGLMFMAATPGYATDLMAYLFGDILMVTPQQLWVMAGLDLVVVGLVVVFYHPLLLVCFDEEFARLRGLKVELWFLLLLGLVALTVVILAAVVGLVMVIALLTLPAGAASRWGHRLGGIMAGAVVLSAAFTTLGLGLSYGPDLPAGACIIVLAGAAYLAAAALVRPR